ncbi:MAG: hypothetical protein U1D67_05975, partial [Dehalococcoidia bacterium]|nr:hypothetical protein [Dehalococcoidia bacterium]
MKKSIGAVVLLLVTAFLYAGCGQPTPQPPPVATKPPQVVTPVPPPPKPEWQQKWETTLAEAKKEGKVNMYALWGQEPRAALSQAFRDKYGIDVEFTSFSRGSEMLAKVQTENSAGLNIADVF